MTMVKIDFEFETPYGKYGDALYVEDGMYSEEELDAMKQERLSNWLLLLEGTSEPAPEPEV